MILIVILLLAVSCSQNRETWFDGEADTDASTPLTLSSWSEPVRADTLSQENAVSCGAALSGDTLRYILPLFPDVNATYWTFAFEAGESTENLAFRITGKFPRARYAGFNCYDFVQASVIAHIRDDMIEPDGGSTNPFLPGSDRETEKRSFTLWFVPEGSSRAGSPNTVVIPAGTEKTTIMYRIYLPDEGMGLEGGVDLPVIETFDDETGEPAPCPESSGIDAGMFLELMLRVVTGGVVVDACNAMAADPKISFYHVEGSGYMPNEDNRYLITGFGYIPDTPVAVLSFRPPSFPDRNGTWITGSEDVRYWSLNMGGNIWTGTSGGLCDTEMLPDAEGNITVVIGPSVMGPLVESRGYNFIPWGIHVNRSMIYRQMCPAEDFEGSVLRVPIFSKELPLDGQRAEEYIGAYAPVGRYVTMTEFIAMMLTE